MLEKVKVLHRFKDKVDYFAMNLNFCAKYLRAAASRVLLPLLLLRKSRILFVAPLAKQTPFFRFLFINLDISQVQYHLN